MHPSTLSIHLKSLKEPNQITKANETYFELKNVIGGVWRKMEQQWRNKGGLGVAKWMEVEDGVE